MRIVKIAEAKAQLSRHLDYVRKGGRVRIVDRDEPVAELVPVEPLSSTDDDEVWLAAMEKKGVLRRGRPGAPSSELLRQGPGGPSAGVLAALLEERKSGR